MVGAAVSKKSATLGQPGFNEVKKWQKASLSVPSRT
jgi:hypothetical protein